MKIYSIKNEKKCLTVSFLLFFIVFFVGDRVLAKVGAFAYDLSSMPDAKMYSGRGRADVIVLGNSRAYHHLDEKLWSKELGFDVKVYAIEAASMEYNEAILLDYIDLYGLPKAVIVEPTCLTWDNGQVVNMRGLTMRAKNLNKLLKKYYQKEYIIGELFNLYKLNSTGYLNTLHKILVEYEQPIFTETISEDKVNEIIKSKRQPYFKNKDDNFNSLLRIKDLAENKGFILNVIVSPFLYEFVADREGYNKWINAIRADIKNDSLIYEYFDVLKNSSNFKDDTHLNNKGVNAFHNKLINDGYFEELKNSLKSYSI